MSHLQILMATRNGARHLDAQLASLLRQTHPDWALRVSDDGSTDATNEILTRFIAANPAKEITIGPGPGRGSAATNFLAMLATAPTDVPLAFCDQDDVWLPQKLSRAVSVLDAHGPEAVYAARYLVSSETLVPLGESPLPPRGLGFGNALVQNVLAGFSLVLGAEAARRIARTVPAAMDAKVPFHDWWVYLIASGLGLPIVHDTAVTTLYRQHGTNVLGARGRRIAPIIRARKLLNRDYAGWIDANLAGLSTIAPDLTPLAREQLIAMAALRNGRGRGRWKTLEAHGIRRQRAAEDRFLRLLIRAGRL